MDALGSVFVAPVLRAALCFALVSGVCRVYRLKVFLAWAARQEEAGAHFRHRVNAARAAVAVLPGNAKERAHVGLVLLVARARVRARRVAAVDGWRALDGLGRRVVAPLIGDANVAERGVYVHLC